MPEPRKPIPLARLNLPAIFQARRRLMDHLLMYEKRKLERAKFWAFCDDVANHLPGTFTPLGLQALNTSLNTLVGIALTKELLLQTCWRIVGNLHRIRRGKPVHPWRFQPQAEWVPAQITRARRRTTRRGDPAEQLSFLILAGWPAGLPAEQTWPHRLCRFAAVRLGCAKFPPRPNELPVRRYHHPTELVGMRLALLIEPALSRAGQPGFKQFSVSPSMRDWNHLLMDRRDRIKPGFACPREYPREWPCWQCPAGYATCPAAVHRFDRYTGRCRGCEREGTFDPEVSTERCLACIRKAEAAAQK